MGDSQPHGPVSAASYVIEPLDLWAARDDPSVPRWQPAGDGGYWVVAGREVPITPADIGALGGVNRGQTRVGMDELPPSAFTPAGRLDALDRGGVAGEVLYPTPALAAAIAVAEDGDAQTRWVRRYNDWLGEFVAAAPNRFAGVAQIPVTAGVDAAIAELRRCVTDLKLTGVQLHAFPAGGAVVNADDDPFWAAVSELNVPVSLNAYFGPTPPARFPSLDATPRVATVLTSLIYTGALDRFPDLKIVTVTPTAGWLPYWLERTDDSFMRFSGLRPVHLAKGPNALPSDYLRTRIAYTFSDGDVITSYPEYLAASSLLWASHFPSMVSAWPFDGVETVSGLKGAGAGLRELLLAGNTRSLYRLPGGAAIDASSFALKPLVHAIPA